MKSVIYCQVSSVKSVKYVAVSATTKSPKNRFSHNLYLCPLISPNSPLTVTLGARGLFFFSFHPPPARRVLQTAEFSFIRIIFSHLFRLQNSCIFCEHERSKRRCASVKTARENGERR